MSERFAIVLGGGRKDLEAGKLALNRMAEWAGVEMAAVLAQNRTERIAWLRFAMMYAVYEVTELSSLEVGKLMKRDQGTVLYGMERVKERMGIEPKYKQEMEELLAELRKGSV